MSSLLQVTVYSGLYPASHSLLWALTCRSRPTVGSILQVTAYSGLYPAGQGQQWALSGGSRPTVGSIRRVTAYSGLYQAGHGLQWALSGGSRTTVGFFLQVTAYSGSSFWLFTPAQFGNKDKLSRQIYQQIADKSKITKISGKPVPSIQSHFYVKI